MLLDEKPIGQCDARPAGGKEVAEKERQTLHPQRRLLVLDALKHCGPTVGTAAALGVGEEVGDLEAEVEPKEDEAGEEQGGVDAQVTPPLGLVQELGPVPRPHDCDRAPCKVLEAEEARVA